MIALIPIRNLEVASCVCVCVPLRLCLSSCLRVSSYVHIHVVWMIQVNAQRGVG